MGEAKSKVDVSHFSVIPYFIVYSMPILFFCSFMWRGIWSLMGVFIAFVFIPIADVVLGKDVVNPTKDEAKELDSVLKFRIITWLYVPVQVAVMIMSIHLASDESIATWEKINYAISAGIVGGAVGLNVAHELNHKRNKFENFLAHVIFATVGYDHFAFEHNYGHHHNVGTPRDPATANLGENIYAFLPRSFVGGYKGAWNIERKVLAKKGKSVWSFDNRILRGYVAEFALLAFCTYFWGIQGGAQFLLQCAFGIFLLECTNYIEHYGLRRVQAPDGTYEPVDPLHSWNAAERMSNYFLFKLQRHSDHHTYPYKRYQSLISHDESAQMPSGYPSMIILALVPPLWFKVMNPRVLELRERLRQKRIAEEQSERFAGGVPKPIKGN